MVVLVIVLVLLFTIFLLCLPLFVVVAVADNVAVVPRAVVLSLSLCRKCTTYANVHMIPMCT